MKTLGQWYVFANLGIEEEYRILDLGHVKAVLLK